MTLPAAASIVIIGAGIQGLAVAHALAEAGERDILVLDGGYFQGGASGRNGTMIRGGFASPEWTGLFSLANRRWIELSRRLGGNVMYSRRGYLLIAEQERTAAGFDASLAVHRAHGVRSERVSREAVGTLAAALDASRVKDALYLRDGGVAPHHAAMHAYLAACRRLGVSVHYHQRVTSIERVGGHADSVWVGDHRIRTERVVIAAGGYCNAVARLANLELPGRPMRLEAMALEPTRALLTPGIALLDRLCYLSQTARGEIVAGAEVPEAPQDSLRSDLPTLTATARALADMVPCTRQMQILRHWAGLIQATPDFSPLIGPHPECGNIWVTGGWAYGFASAPAVGELLARSIRADVVDPLLAPFRISRFAEGKPVIEGGIVLTDLEAA